MLAVVAEEITVRRGVAFGRRRNKHRITGLPDYIHTWYIFDGLYVTCHTPLGQFSKLDRSTTTRVPIPNDMRFRKALGDMFPASTLVAPALFRLLWRYRPRKIRREGCDTDGSLGHHTYRKFRRIGNRIGHQTGKQSSNIP